MVRVWCRGEVASASTCSGQPSLPHKTFTTCNGDDDCAHCMLVPSHLPWTRAPRQPPGARLLLLLLPVQGNPSVCRQHTPAAPATPLPPSVIILCWLLKGQGRYSDCKPAAQALLSAAPRNWWHNTQQCPCLGLHFAARPGRSCGDLLPATPVQVLGSSNASMSHADFMDPRPCTRQLASMFTQGTPSPSALTPMSLYTHVPVSIVASHAVPHVSLLHTLSAHGCAAMSWCVQHMRGQLLPGAVQVGLNVTALSHSCLPALLVCFQSLLAHWC